MHHDDIERVLQKSVKAGVASFKSAGGSVNTPDGVPPLSNHIVGHLRSNTVQVFQHAIISKLREDAQRWKRKYKNMRRAHNELYAETRDDNSKAVRA